MTEQEIEAARVGRRTYHREYQRLRRDGKSPKAARRIAGALGRRASGEVAVKIVNAAEV